MELYMPFQSWSARARGWMAVCLMAALSAACGLGAVSCGIGRSSDASSSQAAAPPAPAPKTDDERPKIVVLGDSLTAGLGLLEAQSYPHLLQEKIDAVGYQYEVVNAGVSGDTTAGGLRRLDWSLQEDVRVLIVALGGNDGLRGLPVTEMKQNLAQIVEAARAKNVVVILAGMEAPPNYGAEYAASFRKVYRDLALQYRLAFVPFLLDKVAGQAALNQADGIHPNPEGAAIVADTVWNVLKPLLDQISVS
jgi:acyl-CoA thioesterase I